jgi:small subunit ribosomal protein S2
MSIKLPAVLELLQAGVHFGHRRSRWHPKMKKFIFTERSGVHVIDLEKTVNELEKATKFVQDTVAKGGVILFVGTKKQGAPIMKKYADEVGMPYIVERWIGGLFTNFANVGKLIRKYKSLLDQKKSGKLEKYTKKEQVEFTKEIERLKRLVGGLGDMSKIPAAIFVLDAKREKTAVTEARTKGVAVVSFCDTNINPDDVDYPIPANDDAVKSIEIITKSIAEAIKLGQAKAKDQK